METLIRANYPAELCTSTKEELLAQKKNTLDVTDDCPICRDDYRVLCRVARHPSTTTGPFFSPISKGRVLSALPYEPLHQHKLPDSSVKEDRTPLSTLSAFLLGLATETALRLVANGSSELMQGYLDDRAWLQAVDGTEMPSDKILALLSVLPESSKLTEKELENYGVIHDPNQLHLLGEETYQKKFDHLDVGQRECFLAPTSSSNMPIPVGKQHDQGVFRFSGKADNLSVLRPMAIEFKGRPYKENLKPVGRKELTGLHYSVLEQALRRVYSISCIQQFLGNIGVFAACADRLWLVWFRRELDPARAKKLESIDVIKLDPASLGYY
eukprot:gene30250-36556_t